LRREFRGDRARDSEVGAHRNTVIYRLDKISRLTALDVREPGVAIALYLACLIAD